MRKQLSRVRWAVAPLTLATLVAAPAWGAGFSIFEAGSKAMGTAGAFTGMADDPSAMFHNVGGLAFLKERSIYGGVTLINSLDSSHEGEAPFPGRGVNGTVENAIFTPIHVYYVKPLNERWTFGAALNNPFGLAVEWDNPDEWAGRFISTRSELVSFDVNLNLGWQVTDRLGVGFGIIGRAAKIELGRRVPAVNPFSQTVVDIAQVDLESDFDSGVGFNVGLLHKISSTLSWGLSYRSAIEIDFGGDGLINQITTGNAQFDGLVAGLLPFNQKLPLTTAIEFPDTASLGVSVALTQRTRLNADINWTGWSTFDVVDLNFSTAPALNSRLDQNYEDAYHYRIGVTYTTNRGRAWRFGYVLDESPQPLETVGPVLPDASRDGFTIGYGTNRWDLALMYLLFDERTTLVNQDDFFGTYNTEVALFGISFKL